MDPLSPTSMGDPLSPKISSEISGVDEFTQKTLFLHDLATQFKAAKGADCLRPLFCAITEELSSLFETSLHVMNHRIASQASSSPTNKAAIEIAEMRLQHKRIAHATAIVQYIGSVVEKVLSRRESECKSFSLEAHRWLSISQPQSARTLQFTYALSLLSAGYASEAREILSALSPFFPKEVEESLPPNQGLVLFVRKYDNVLRASLALADQETKSLIDILQSSPIMASLVSHLSPPDVRTLRETIPNWNELTSESFPGEYFHNRAERILKTPYFSLAHAHPVCLDTYRVALYAVFRDGFQYDYVSEGQKRAPLVIKLAVLSILRDCRERLGEFLRKNPSNVGGIGLISFVHGASRKMRSWSELAMEEKNFFSFLIYLCPHDEGICEFSLQNHGKALRWAGAEIKRNERLVLIAVRQDGMAIQDADDEMRDRYAVAKAAVQKNPWAYGFISARLQARPELRKLSGRGSD